jgi:predicted TPR repeat methyltransferase
VIGTRHEGQQSIRGLLFRSYFKRAVESGRQSAARASVVSPKVEIGSASPVPESDPRLALVERFFRGTGGSYDTVVNVATFGIDRLWKRRIVSQIPAGAGRILDLACGTGISTIAIARRFPNSRIVGVELREEYLALARHKVRRHRMHNVDTARPSPSIASLPRISPSTRICRCSCATAAKC